MAERSFTVPTPDGDLTVWEWGEGPAVLALHGITAHGRSFRTLAETLPGHRILAPDLRGRGASRDVGPPYGMAAHGDDCARILDVAGVDRATIVGHSMGAFVALVAAHRHAEQFERLVLVDGGLPLALPDAVLALPADRLIGAVIGPALDRLRKTFPSHDAYRAMWRDHWALADDWGSIIEAYIDEDLIGDAPELRPAAVEAAVLADGTSELTEDDVERALAELAHPTVLLAAEGGLVGPDPVYADDQVAEAVSHNPQLTAHRVTGVNHYTILLSERGAAAIAAAVEG